MFHKTLTSLLGMAALVSPTLAAGEEAAADAAQAQPAAPAALPWGMDCQAALAQAKAEGKPVLVDFTGSDWCGYCVQLSKVVFGNPDFIAYAKDKFVFLEVDLPNKPKFSQDQLRKNQALADHFEVDGFPTILVLSPEGYPVGGFAGFAQPEQVKKYLEAGREAVAKLAAASQESKLDVLLEIRRGLDEGIVSCAGDLERAIVALDPEDKSGIARARKVHDELETAQRLFNQSISRKGTAGLEESTTLAADLLKTVQPENKFHLATMKASAAFLLCQSREDLEKWQKDTLADLDALDPSANAQEVAAYKARVASRLENVDQALQTIASTRESIDQRFKAVQEANAEQQKEEEAAGQPTPAPVADAPVADEKPVPAPQKPVVEETPVELHWGTDFAAARKQAQELNRPILVEFTGSDWCVYCVKLHNDVFAKPEFAKYAKDKFVCMEVDIPDKPKFSQEQQEHNQQLADKYHVDGFPTILVLNPQGEVTGGFGGYMAYDDAIARLDTAVDNIKALQDAAKLPDADRLEALVAVYANMDDSVAAAADYLADEIERLDTTDEYGLRYERQIEEESVAFDEAHTRIMQENGVAGLDMVLEFVRDYESKILPENRLQLILTKMGALLLKAKTKADLEKLVATISADLQSLDLDRVDMESAQEVQDALSSILDEADAVLESSRQGREDLEKVKAEYLKSSQK